jgi:phage terminase small subunit
MLAIARVSHWALVGSNVYCCSFSPAGREAGIKSCAFKVGGANAYGWLKIESGDAVVGSPEAFLTGYHLHERRFSVASSIAGFSERSANNQGTRLMADDAIRAEIEARLASTFDRYAITSERIVRELAKIGFGNIDDFVAKQDDGSLVVDFGTATREQMASLKSIEIDQRTIDGAAAGVRKIKISMSDKRQTLMDLAKIARMLPADRHEHPGPGGGPIEVKAEHKIDIKSLSHEQREQLRQILLMVIGKSS